MISKKKIIILLILTIIGLLSALSILTKTMNIDVPITDPLCKIGKIEDKTTVEEKYLFDCEEFEEKDPRSNILGLPQSILATSIYVGMLLFLIIALFINKDNTIKILIIPFIASIFNLVYSLFVSVFMYIVTPPPFCLYSTIMYVCNIIIFILLIVPYMKSLTDSIKNAIKSPFYIITPLVIILLCVGMVILIPYLIENKSLTKKDMEEIEANLSKDEYPVDTEGAPVRGKNEIGVEIVVFEDFQCPQCRRTAPIFDKLLKHYDNKISFIFKHYPLEPECFPIQIEPLHEFACEASYASVAAKEQGKFWEFYDLLYSDKVDNIDIFENYAKKLNLDLEKFKTDYEAERIRNEVKRDTAEGHYALRLTSTPSVFINKRLWKGVKDFSTLRKVVEYFKTMNAVVDKNTTKEEYNPIEYLSKEPVKINTENSPTIGKNELGVEMVIFEDFQCPACQRTSEEIKKLLEHYNYKISLTFKHYPLEPECFPKDIPTLHEWACELSYASMAADKQGKFWEYYKILFSNEIRSVPIRLSGDLFNNFIIAKIQNENDKKLILDKYKEKDGEYLLKTDVTPEDKDKIVEILKAIGYAKYIIDGYAKELNLDMKKFNEDYNSEEVRNFIKRDTEEGFNEFNITSTPSIFFNGRYYDGYKEVEELIKVVDYIINEKNTPNS